MTTRGGRTTGNHGAGRNNYDSGDYREERDDGIADMNMEYYNRKRAERVESEVVPGARADMHNGELKGNELAVVPLGAGVVSPPPMRDPKCTRKEEDEKDGQNNVVKILAGSFEGRRRGQ